MERPGKPGKITLVQPPPGFDTSNAEPKIFRDRLLTLPYLGYRVDQIDSQIICVVPESGVWLHDLENWDTWLFRPSDIQSDIAYKVAADVEPAEFGNLSGFCVV